MVSFHGRLATASFALLQTAAALKATILADTNRDGRVDVQGDSDLTAKDTWTNERGALFLANIGDTDRRCAGSSQLDTCNDAEGTTLRDPRYLAPLRTLPITGLSSSAVGTVQVAGTVAAAKTRIFAKSGTGWAYVSPSTSFDAKALAGGIELGIDARDVRRPDGWDGRATVVFAVSDGAEKAEDMVALRVAPVLTHHHVQPAQKVITSYRKASTDADLGRFVKGITEKVADAGISEPVHALDEQDRWTQDFFEPGYTSMPGPDGPVSLRVMIRSVQRNRPAGATIFKELRSAGVGAVQQPGSGGTRDSMGNLETIPPFAHNGASFPAGRTIMGASDAETPLMLAFLRAQEIQDPLVLDTSWLAVGHVDEFLQFLPADSPRGWVLVADDPLAGLALLKKASKEGHGAIKAVSRGILSGESSQCLPTSTIDQVLALKSLDALQTYAAGHIDDNIARIKNATGLTDDEIFRMPATFYDTNNGVEPWPCKYSSGASVADAQAGGPAARARNIIEAAMGPAASRVQARQARATELVALYPGIVNGLVLDRTHIIAPNPWGPIIDGVDILASEATKLYQRLGFNVTYQDDWFSHHILWGEVHCGTNTLRAAGDVWWKK